MNIAAIFPGRFDSSDVVAWFREFDACSEAIGWNTESACLQYNAIPEADRKTYDDVKKVFTASLPRGEQRNVFCLFRIKNSLIW